MNLRPVSIGVIVGIGLGAYLVRSFGWRQGALFATFAGRALRTRLRPWFELAN